MSKLTTEDLAKMTPAEVAELLGLSPEGTARIDRGLADLLRLAANDGVVEHVRLSGLEPGGSCREDLRDVQREKGDMTAEERRGWGLKP